MNPPHNSMSIGSVLARLRMLAHGATADADDLSQIARQQATLLWTLLATPVHEIPERLPTLIPNIRIECISNIPVPGISFWVDKHWYIHVRASGTKHEQGITVLRELKRIIDYPLRNKLNIAAPKWEKLTIQFADDVAIFASRIEAVAE